ncbi:5' nucleotidase, NT5C type [Halalkalibacter flavus]|uniref:5' nucleotidase, NT5C type n=1 Tax=Halalkalibacter flavus TaxID=3090668 RepID=UPI002FCB8C59
MLRVGIDLDGVVVDTYGCVMEHYNDLYEKVDAPTVFPAHTNVAKYLVEHFGLTKEEAAERWGGDMNMVFSVSNEVTESIKYLNEIAKFAEIYYVSARPANEGVKQVTSDWLKANNAPYSENLVINQAKKDQVVKELEIDFFIEDAPHHILNLNQHDIDVLILNTGYNHLPELEGISRFEDWKSIHEFLQKQSSPVVSK